MRKIIKLLLGLLIIVNICYVWSGATKFGAQSIDVYANWLFKAKVLYLYQGTYPKFIYENIQYKAAHWQYPPLWPVSVLAIYKLWGFNENYIYRVFPFAYVLVLILAGVNLRKSGISRKKTWLIVYVYSMMGPLLAQGGRYHAGNADIWIAILGWLILGFRKNKFLTTVLVMAAAMIKTEGVFWAVFLLDSKWIWISLLPTLVWQIFLKNIGIRGDFGLAIPGELPVRIWGLIRGSVEEFFKVNNWYILWPIFFLSSKKHPLWKPLWLMLFGFAVVYLGTSIDTYNYVSSSLDRILLQLSPLWITMLASYPRHKVICHA